MVPIREYPYVLTPYGRLERLEQLLADLDAGDPLVTLAASAMILAELRAVVRELKAKEAH